MKSILIINQHTSNRGDESAGMALVRGLCEMFSPGDLSILYNSKIGIARDCLPAPEGVVHLPYEPFRTFDKILMLFSLFVPGVFTRVLLRLGSDSLAREVRQIVAAEKVISAPGGVNIGLYKDWRYLWRIVMAIKLKKDVALYSISFGPLPNDRLFRRASIYALKNVNFLSLRDSKSQSYAAALDINFHSSIDTAFLFNHPPPAVPEELRSELLEEYVIFVPNALHKWHVNYLSLDEGDFEGLYKNICRSLLERGLSVVMLPQMFGSENDVDFFRQIAASASEYGDRVFVIEDIYSSDVQQTIVSNAQFLVGARYHSIIFAINNEIPFLSLAYEDKMTNTLDLLGLEKRSIKMSEALISSREGLDKTLGAMLDNYQTDRKAIRAASTKARSVANHTFECLQREFFCD